MMYMKKFPEKREPFFWNIITCELAGNDPSASDMDRKVLRPLAFGFLSKAAADAAVKVCLALLYNYCVVNTMLRKVSGFTKKR